MKIVLVRPNIPSRWMIVPPLALGYIAAAAKKAGHKAIIHDAWLKNEGPQRAAFRLSYLSWEQVDIIGVQVYQDTVEWTKAFFKYMRIINAARGKYSPYMNAKLIVGGPYVAALGEAARIEMGADAAVIGEFDNHIDDTLIKIMQGDVIITMPKTDVNEVPVPDWDLMPLPQYWPYLNPITTPTRGKRIGHIQSSRGCPFHCTFCAGHVTHGYKVRFRDIDNVIDEIKYLKKRWNINEVWFQDDNVIVNYERGISLFEKLAKLDLHVRLPLGIRIENVDNTMARAMKNAGVYFTGIGIESGNTRVLKRIKKRINLEKAKEAINILTKHKIRTAGFFILGLPTETRSEMEDTVKYALSTKLNHAQIGTFLSYPGAEDYNEKSSLSEKELIKIQRNATRRFYLRMRILWGIIKNFRLSQIKALIRHPWARKWI